MSNRKPRAIPVSEVVTLESDPPASSAARKADADDEPRRIVATYTRKPGLFRRILRR